jgi:hypothetical protein
MVCDGSFAENSTAVTHSYSKHFEFNRLQSLYRDFEFYSLRQQAIMLIFNNLYANNLPNFRANSA